MLKYFFMALSKSKFSESVLLAMPFGKRFASRFVAGYTIKDFIGVAENLQARGLLVAADHLGEEVKTKKLVEKAKTDYLNLIKEISLSKLKGASISIKLSQLGLSINEKLAIDNVKEIAACANRRDVKLELDMEGSQYTDATIKIYKQLLKQHPGTALALQANLKRTDKDLRSLLKLKDVSIRLVKGAYLEPEDIALQDKKDVDLAYEFLLTLLFSPKAKKSGCRPLVGTHDPHMIHYARRLIKRNKWKSHELEFEMLYGIGRKLQKQLLYDGYKVRRYVPYGNAWYPYFMRRLAERPANVVFLVKSLFT